ncbi:MAG: hypothetical protein EPN37_04925 [Chitinophagaceae bacterium]|nr:MAG: hypothetical protein EPN37_04925 [Chitinophagaceae bacterium]
MSTLISENCNAQTLAGTDALCRTLPLSNRVGPLKQNRKVALFYFLWQGQGTSAKFWDLNKIVCEHPEVLNNFDNPFWGSGGMYYWGRPVYGYYSATDYWVQLRNIQLLTDAQVDLLVIDATNTYTYPKAANTLMKAMDAVRKQGWDPPKIVFYTNTASGETMQKVYDEFYKNNAPYKHPECWFYLDGKPLIIGHSDEAEGKDYEHFFTFRESQWPNESQKLNGWPWISFTRPQKVFYNSHGQKEIINVSVAQHPYWKAGMGGSAFYGFKGNWGRSYHNGYEGHPQTDMPYGYNIQEQWNYAIAQNTPFIFVTGWNEWVAPRLKSNDGDSNHSWFCDEASPEYSRDIEPTLTANLKDDYYMQLVSDIREYKGVASNPLPSVPKTIHDFNDWKEVYPVYRDYAGDTQPRRHAGAQTEPKVIYINNTGRNDFDTLKVARDKQYIYFYAKTVSKITPNSGSNWMRLYLNTDRNWNTGWLGYNYRVAGGNNLQQYINKKWKTIDTVQYRVKGNQMMISIPRGYLNLPLGKINLEFKWSDNMQQDGDPLDWYINGDTAPGGRFNFIYAE